ncbi:hypothetical protein B9479_006580 [Cryptococcus floricola]|uniref:Uncharacterized protein n=1 Tax=Cryptococcus floricola TaxID=2591691 RepID=A0A5D3AMT3_9TREE|nr:hypothetical protein B9479_006580 [Cryptococcus floricola]
MPSQNKRLNKMIKSGQAEIYWDDGVLEGEQFHGKRLSTTTENALKQVYQRLEPLEAMSARSSRPFIRADIFKRGGKPLSLAEFKAIARYFAKTAEPSKSRDPSAKAKGATVTSILNCVSMFSSNDDPKQTSLEGRFGYTPSSAASQPSTSNLPAHKTTKRAAASSLEAHSTTAKKSRQKPPASEGAQRPLIASAPIDMTNDEIVSDSDSESDISSDEDDDDIQEDDDISANNLDDGYAKCVEAREMDRSSLPAEKDDFWSAYLIKPLETHASRLNLKATPLPDVTRERLAELLDFVLGSKRLNYFWTVYPMSKKIRERLLELWGLFMPTNFQELLAGPEPPSGAQIRSLIDANGVYCNDHGVRLDKLEGRGEVQRRCLGAYWKVALPKGDVDSDDTDNDDADDQEADVHHHPPPPIRLYTGQTAKVSPSDNSMGFRTRWRDHVNEAYGHDEAVKKDR